MISTRFFVLVIAEPIYAPIGDIELSAPSVKSPIPIIINTAPSIKARNIAAGTGNTVTRSNKTIDVTGRTDESDSRIFSDNIVLLKSFIILSNIYFN
jgi:hypothetical protein